MSLKQRSQRSNERHDTRPQRLTPTSRVTPRAKTYGAARGGVVRIAPLYSAGYAEHASVPKNCRLSPTVSTGAPPENFPYFENMPLHAPANAALRACTQPKLCSALRLFPHKF